MCPLVFILGVGTSLSLHVLYCDVHVDILLVHSSHIYDKLQGVSGILSCNFANSSYHFVNEATRAHPKAGLIVSRKTTTEVSLHSVCAVMNAVEEWDKMEE